MGLQWRDVVGAGVVVLRVASGKALIELGDGLTFIEEPTGNCRRALSGVIRSFHEGMVLRGTGCAKS